MTVDLKLGRKPYVEDHRDLIASNYVAQLPQPPAEFDIVPNVNEWQMCLNDKLGDCTVAAVAHMVQVWVDAVTGKTPTIRNPIVEQFYQQVSGYVPGDPSTDDGANMRDVLKRWLKQEFDKHSIKAFARVNNFGELRTALWAFGGLYLGLNLPLTAQEQLENGEAWDVVAADGDQAGSWGGHCVNAISFDAKGFTVVTWGKRQYLSNEFLVEYGDEAYGIISPDWLGAGKTPEGFDLAQLESDLAAIGK